MSTDDIARDARSIRRRVSPSPLPGYEYVRGYGVYSLPLDTGHVLALRIKARSGADWVHVVDNGL